MKRANISFGSTTTYVLPHYGTSFPQNLCTRHASKKTSPQQNAGPQKYFFFQLIPRPKGTNIFQSVKQLFSPTAVGLLQLHHPQILTPEQQNKVYRSKIVPGAKVFWKDEEKRVPHTFLVQSVENNQVSITQVFRKGDIPSINTEVKVVSIDRIIGGRAKDAEIPLSLPEKLLADRIRILFPTHINSLKFFCKSSKSYDFNLSVTGNTRIFASEMIWRDEGDKTQVKLNVVPVQEDVVNPKQGALMTGVRGLMTIIVDGETIPVFVNEKDALTLVEGRKDFFQRFAMAIITILGILILFAIFIEGQPIHH